MRCIALLLTMAMLLPACPEPGDTTATGPGTPTGDASVTNPPTDLDSLKAQLTQAYCNALVDCPGGSPVAFFSILFSSPSECVNSLTFLGDQALEEVEKALARGTVTYNATVAQSCLSTIESAALCAGQFGVLATACEGAFVGSLNEGDSCYSGLECASGLYCNDDAGCPGVCTAMKAVGESCSSSSECLFSGSGAGIADCWFQGGGSPTCTNITYGAPAAVGQPCGSLGSPPDISEVACQSGAVCDAASGEAGTCVATVPVGSACTFQVDVCADNAQCIPSPDFSATCVAVTLVKTAGGGCAPADVAFCDPFSRLTCDEASQTCQPYGDGSLGATCPADSFFSFPGLTCNEGLYCSPDSATCVTAKADGESCNEDEECLSGTCEFSSGTCTSEEQCTN